MPNTETNRIENKEQLNEDFEQEVIAFLNYKEGGIVYVGVRKDGQVVGLKDVDLTQLQIKDRIKNNIQPSTLGLFDVIVETIDDKEVIKVVISSGTEKPYYLRKKGRTPEGCYIRIGSSKEQMTFDMIDEMYSKRVKNPLKEIESPRQDLTFRQLKIYYEENGMQLNDNFAKNLNLLTSEGKYNYNAYLLADENNVSIKLVKYLGTNKLELVENHEYGYCCIITATHRILERLVAENTVYAKIEYKGRKEVEMIDSKALKEAVILPIQYPQLFEGKRQPWKGILLYGPPGTGKSYLAKAAATETKGRFFSVSAANIVSKFMGESERLLKALFELARKNKPAVIFIDEIDSVLSARSEGENEATRRLKTEFLIQMQGVGKDDKGILVLGATNIPWGLDPAVRRRFQKKIYISLPEANARKLMLKLNLGDTYNDLTDEQFTILGNLTKGYSGSDIYNLTQDAIYGPLRKCQRATHFKHLDPNHIVPCSPSDPGAKEMKINDIDHPEMLVAPVVTFEDFILSLQKMKPTVSEEDLKRQQQFTQEFGTEG